MVAVDVGSWVFKSGKHKDMTYAHVAEKDVGYLRRLAALKDYKYAPILNKYLDSLNTTSGSEPQQDVTVPSVYDKYKSYSRTQLIDMLMRYKRLATESLTRESELHNQLGTASKFDGSPILSDDELLM